MDISDLFIFSARGRERGNTGRQGGGVSVFFFGGGGLNIFIRRRNSHQEEYLNQRGT